MDNATANDIGRHVVFFDPVGQPHDALITAVWGPDCINIVLVQTDENQTDTYGRKIERETSLMHGSVQQAHGNFWLWPKQKRGEKRPE